MRFSSFITTSLAATLFLLPTTLHAHPSWGIVVDHHGQVYFSDLEAIWKIDTNGTMDLFRAGVGGRHIHELTIDAAGNLYGDELTYEPATERFTAALWRMTPAGEFSYTLPPTDAPPRGMSIWKDSGGNTFSAIWKSNEEHETLILKRAPDGRVTTLFGSQQTADSFRQVVLYSVGGMAFGEDGSLYVADGSDIWKVAADDGSVLPFVRNIVPRRSNGLSEPGTPSRFLGIAVDGKGNVFAADHVNRCVLKFTPDGIGTTVLRAEESWSPWGVASRDGSLYILEYGHTPPGTADGVRVRRLSPDGSITRVWASETGGHQHPETKSRVVGTTTTIVSRAEPPYAIIAATALGTALLLIALIRWRARRKGLRA